MPRGRRKVSSLLLTGNVCLPLAGRGFRRSLVVVWNIRCPRGAQLARACTRSIRAGCGAGGKADAGGCWQPWSSPGLRGEDADQLRGGLIRRL